MNRLAVLFLIVLILSFAVTAIPVKALTLEDGLLLHYDMDKGYGTTLDDLSSSNNDGIINGASWVNGKYGKALSFDGISQYARVPANPSLNPTRITLACWVKFVGSVPAGDVQLIQKAFTSHSAPYYQYSIVKWSAGPFLFSCTIGGTSYAVTGGSSLVDTFYFVVGTYDGTTMNLYINDVLVGSLEQVGSISGYDTPVDLGRYTNVEAYTRIDVLDELRIYNRGLSQAEVTELYQYSPYQVPSSFNTHTAIYALSTTQIVNNLTGYELSETAPSTTTGTNITVVESGSQDSSWGWRIYLRYQSGAVELTSGTPNAVTTRASDGTGLQTTTFSASASNLQFGYTAIELVLYSRFGTGTWTAQAVFLTDLLFYTRVLANTWTFQLWTERSISGGNTYATARWGNSSYVTGTSGLVYKAPDQFDWMTYHMRNGDPFNFVVAPYVFLIGNLFYAVVCFGFCGTLYVRYKNSGVVLVLLILLGGTGGIANLMLGDAVLGVVWLLATFGFAALFWRVFR
jgi:hypothetical protein